LHVRWTYGHGHTANVQTAVEGGYEVHTWREDERYVVTTA
jgi:hypothetical protein